MSFLKRGSILFPNDPPAIERPAMPRYGKPDSLMDALGSAMDREMRMKGMRFKHGSEPLKGRAMSPRGPAMGGQGPKKDMF